ncbi:MAG TPA: hypothetical protein VHM91_06675, partial [Verrucomicrobiales bacterium]|nr:hypothetical protein [Verrucomicrobiales bacterium]
MNQHPEGPQHHMDDEHVETVYVQEEELPPKRGYWYRIGGGSLTVSLIVHGVFVIIALLIIWRTTDNSADPPPE